ncbi:Acid phosphatase type 7 [Goodea atripinnis]|uniref:Acid phosphatase type 7 n=1 Tax=Goodea atripinnis TaxID=208336 RepID=A0ABV0NJQ2_9TELE
MKDSGLSMGCRERTDRFNPNPKEWSAFRSTDYGYSRMQVVNATHIYLEQVSDDQVSAHGTACAQAWPK